MQILDVDLVINYDNTLLLLNSVPNTYNHLISTLLYKNDNIKFDIVSNARLCSESKSNHYNKVGKDKCVVCHNKGH